MIDGEKEAQEALKNVWGNRHFPVDSYIIATQFGIRVIETILPKDVAGAIIKKKGNDPIIALNKTDSVNRKRFSCAHELGRYVYSTKELVNEYEYIDFHEDRYSLGVEEKELFANVFAISLLMPGEELNKLPVKRMPLFLIAQHFGVTDDAVIFFNKLTSPIRGCYFSL